MKLLYFILLITFFTSCTSIKEKRNQTFFRKWYNETSKLTQINTSNEIENSIKEIATIEFCDCNLDINKLKKKFPRLEYRIFQEQITVSIYEELGKNSFTLSQKEIFIDSLFMNRVNCLDNSLKTLILTKKYKKKLRKLKYGFGSEFGGKNKSNAKVIIESHHSVKYYDLPMEISQIEFNKPIDSSIVTISTTYDIITKRYIKINGLWKFDSELENLTE